ncbi:helix-turn-helix domain-containing protein [Sinorhizobium meliloti WSM1022]|jgi:transcriptional regulator with XRE-family HTH domain|uniref:Transcription regulator n=5 Tax=Sinorhizobium TaxID=28105 RepID=Q92QD6_RHIME|nr:MULTISPECIES: helix-turn-helix domain-containing protein [Sinorhizobium]PII38831.1 transcriptional regulator [Sinorhizobium meliloti CCBAU 01290]PST27513.1 transcriptional regulator [Mesorhizobium loti]TWA92135.1 transcriptional regulator with XRE-family HTH domain [Ensifer sp. SEMIA 134]TWB25104.1 transcriptional regulator with XRE-family HTH domain [Ensifer sp. SEMIA 135]AEG03951.1 helix-turn-helix domain protein [Sinorhizobium meliloti BL225C]
MLLSTENAIARLRETGDGDTLGGRIWRARDATGLSTKELASKLGVRNDTISSWERDRAEPRANRLFMLAGVLGVTPAWLMAGIGRAPDDSTGDASGDELRKQLDLVKKLHEQTAEAIAALEMEFERLDQDVR